MLRDLVVLKFELGKFLAGLVWLASLTCQASKSSGSSQLLVSSVKLESEESGTSGLQASPDKLHPSSHKGRL